MATVQQQTTQLEFHQAMADFKVMFPTMDVDVIEEVLRSNHGAVDSTIDQLLAMNMDNENEKIRQELDQKEESEPLPFRDPSSQTAPSAEGEESRGDNLGTPLHRQRGWAPPLLGPLPDDFLRLPPDSFAKQEMWLSFLWNMMRVRRRWKRRERRRWKLEMNENYKKRQLEGELEDERIALFLQNEEFMAELRWNKDFLSMLDKESPSHEKTTNFPQSRTTDEDAVFKERLRNMGKSSRKKFSQLARVFTGRKKRSSSAKAILSQGPAPSRDNLLLQEEDRDSDGA